jgi:hypothetical protein
VVLAGGINRTVAPLISVHGRPDGCLDVRRTYFPPSWEKCWRIQDQVSVQASNGIGSDIVTSQDQSTFSTDSTGGAGGSREETPLERRRLKTDAAKAVLEQAQVVVSALDGRLETNATQSRENEAALERSLDEVARLKKALKAGAQERRKLAKARKDARAAVAKADRKAQSTEAKYDRLVLAEIVRREKAAEHAKASRGSLPETPAPPPVNTSPPSTPDSEPTPASAVPKAEQGPTGTQTATRTAARTTAARARTAAGAAPAPTGQTRTRRPATPRASAVKRSQRPAP